MKSQYPPNYIIKVDPDIKLKDITEVIDIYDKLKKKIGLTQNIPIYSLRFLRYFLKPGNYLTLPECGFDFSKNFSYKIGSPINLYFKYDNINFSRPFSSCQSIFEIILELTTILHTVQRHIILKNIPPNISEISQIQSTEENPIILEVTQDHFILEIFKWSELKGPTEEYYCLLKASQVSHLKSTIAAYKEMSDTSVKIFLDDQVILNDVTTLESLKNKKIFFDFQTDAHELSNIDVILRPDLKEDDILNIPTYTQQIVGGFSDLYGICVYLEKIIFIDRHYIFFSQEAKNNEEIKTQKSISITIHDSIELSVFLYDQDSKKNICYGSFKFPILLRGIDLKKIIANKLRNKIKLNPQHFGIAISDQIIFHEDYIAKYLNPAKDKNEVFIIQQNNESNVYKFLRKGKGARGFKSLIIPKEMTMLEVKKILFPDKPPQLINFYKKTKLSDNFKFHNINPEDKTIEYDFFQRPDNTKYSIFFKKLGSSYLNFISDSNKTVKDIFYEIEKKIVFKKKKVYYYRACPKSNNQISFSFYEKLNQLILSSQDSVEIDIFKEKGNKIKYNVYSPALSILEEYNDSKSVFRSGESLDASIKNLLKSKTFNFESTQKLVLISDFVQLDNNDIPILCFPKLLNHTYIINYESESKTLKFTNKLFKIKITFQKNEYNSVSEKVSKIFHLDPNEIEFYYKFSFIDNEICLPPFFSVESFNNDDEIRMELPPKKQYSYSFRSTSNQVSKKFSIYNYVNNGFDQFKLGIQKELGIFKYSTRYISLKFEENPIESLQYFEYLNEECIIDVDTKYCQDEHHLSTPITVNVDIQDKTEVYNLLNDDRIVQLRKLVSIEYDVADYNEIIIKNSKGQEMKNGELIQDDKYTVDFPKIGIICNGSLVTGDTDIKIDIEKFLNGKKAKEIIRNKLKLNDDNFSLFTQHGQWFKEIQMDEQLMSYKTTIFAHRFLLNFHINHITSNKINEIDVQQKLHISELCTLSILRPYIYVKLNYMKIDFSFTSDGKNIASTDLKICDYLKKQKEMEPNSQENHLYVFNKQELELNSELQDKTPDVNLLDNQEQKDDQQKTNLSSNKSIYNNKSFKMNKSLNEIIFSNNNNTQLEFNILSSEDNNNQQEVNQQDSLDNNNNNNEIHYTFYDHENNHLFKIQLGEKATVSEAKDKLWGQAKVNKSSIELIFGGKRLRDKVLLKSLRLTGDDQIELFIHNYNKIRLMSTVALRTRSNATIHPPVKEDL